MTPAIGTISQLQGCYVRIKINVKDNTTSG